MSDNYMVGAAGACIFVIGLLLGVAFQYHRGTVADYDEICVNAGYHRTVEIQGDLYCATPIYGFNGVLMNSKDPTPANRGVQHR